jgi:PLP dependent protein
MLIGPQNLPERLEAVRGRIAHAAVEAGRTVDSVTLLAVGKGQPVDALREAATLGVRHFGENYLQEAVAKVDSLRDLGLTWHFIGQVQANKTREIAQHFDWVHAVDRLRIAQRLSAQRPHYAAPLNVCIQVNLAHEASKGGVSADEVPSLAAQIAGLPRLALRGLMCLPPAGQTHWFAELRRMLEAMNSNDMRLDTLSMGMSADIEAAVREGATIVRVGTGIFGARP